MTFELDWAMSEFSEHTGKAPFKQEILKGFGVLALLVFLMLWLAGAFIDKVQPGPPVPGAAPPKLATQKVERMVFPLIVDQVGTVSAKDEARVSSRIMAQVKEILVTEGDSISVSQLGSSQEGVLARLDNRDMLARVHQAEQQVLSMQNALEAGRAKLEGARAQLAAARANREKSVSDYRRFQDLHQNQAATGQQLQHMKTQRNVAEAQVAAAGKDVQAAEQDTERFQAQLKEAEAGLAEARVMLSHTAIRAPFSGRVIKKLVNVGDMVAPGQTMFILDNTSAPEIHANVTESLIPRMKIGQEVPVHIDALNRSLVGILQEVVPRSDPGTRTMLVKISLAPDPSLVSGLFARIQIHQGQYEALVIPVKAVREVGQLQLVDVVTPAGIPQRRFVTLGKTHGELVEVLSGLNENDAVVIP